MSKFDYYDNNCWHYVVDLWEEITGKRLEVTHQLSSRTYPGLCKLFMQNLPILEKGFNKWSEPKEPSICVITQGYRMPHVGVYFNGKVHHVSAFGKSAVTLEELLRYYEMDPDGRSYAVSFYTEKVQ